MAGANDSGFVGELEALSAQGGGHLRAAWLTTRQCGRPSPATAPKWPPPCAAACARRPDLGDDDVERRAQTCTAMVIAAFSIAKADPDGAGTYLDLARDAITA